MNEASSEVIELPSGPSFDCSLATSPDEVAICSSIVLAALDAYYSELYQSYAKMPDATSRWGRRILTSSE